MRAITVSGPQTLKLDNLPMPVVPIGGARVQVTGCGLCGSDLDKLLHRTVSAGTVLGHEIVGVIESLHPSHTSNFSVGNRVMVAHHVPCQTCHYCAHGSPSMCRQFKATNFTPGGFAEYIAIGPEHLNQTCFHIPDAVTDLEASCIEPLACVIRGIERGHPTANGTVLVMGLGFIGLLAGQVYQRFGLQVFGLDLLAERVALSKQSNSISQAYQSPSGLGQFQTDLLTQTPLGQVDTVFLSTVNAHTLTAALQWVRDGGTLILFSSSPSDTQLDPNQLYFRELSIIPTYSPSLESLRKAKDLVFQQQLNLDPLVTHSLPLDRLAEGVELYRSGRAVKVFCEMVS